MLVHFPTTFTTIQYEYVGEGEWERVMSLDELAECLRLLFRWTDAQIEEWREEKRREGIIS